MALTTESNEAFLREVDEELRREQMGTAWRRYGVVFIGVIVAALAIFGGYLWWQAQEHKARGVASEQMVAALDDLKQGKGGEAEAKLKSLASGSNEGYRGAAKLALAAHKVERNDLPGAIAAYGEIAADSSIPGPFRDLALIRTTYLAFDELKPEQVVQKMKPLAVKGDPWFGSAGELTAMAYLKMNQPAKAGATFAALAADKGVPDSIRSRAVRIASALGVDAVAAIPAAEGK